MATKTPRIDDAPLTPDEELEIIAYITAFDITAAQNDPATSRRARQLLAAGLGTSLLIWLGNMGAAGHYVNRNTGRVVPPQTVVGAMDDSIVRRTRQMRQLSQRLQSGDITLADWRTQMQQHVKAVHLMATALERGGWANMQLADLIRAREKVRREFDYLANFVQQLQDGEQRMDGTFLQRTELYGKAARTTFYESRQANLSPGWEYVRSHRSLSDSCVECVKLDGVWFRVGDRAYKMPGNRICNRNCGCYEEYGRMVDDTIQGEVAELFSPVRTRNEDIGDLIVGMNVRRQP